MGRAFATVYRVVLVGISLSALVLSIMSATSCAFVEFNHQYKDDGRRFLFLDSWSAGGDRRKLPPSAAMPDQSATDAYGDTTTTTHPNGTATTTYSNGTATTTHPNGTNTTTHSNGTAITTHTNGTKTTTHANGTAITTHANGTSTTTHAGAATAQIAGPAATHDAAPSPTATASVPTPVQGSSSSVSSAGAVSDGASASASGESGLFCDGTKSLSITELWGGDLKDVEDKIADASDRNQSEELARNAAIVAAMFGSLIVSVLVVGSMIGWRCFCEGWIVGLISLMACVSQGVTFLFFNSERYCDGDIINEIINQKPCVLGEGGKYSVTALILYAVVMVMVCRLPKDDPYGWFCRKDKEPVRSSDPVGDGASPGGGKLGLFGSKKGNSDAENGNTARSGREHERPNWLSEEQARTDEENEII